jgi:tetratricopeptide (TPR) repeat protein
VTASFWIARDYYQESRKWCQAALKRSESLPEVEEARAKIYGMLAWSSIAIGDHSMGREAAQAGAALARGAGDSKTLGRLLSVAALACTFLGDFDTGEAAIVEAESLARANGYLAELALMLTTRAQMTYFAYGDIERAKGYLDEAVSLSRKSGLYWATTMSVFGAARLAGAVGDLATARARFLESAEAAKRVGNKRLMYSCYSELAHVLRENGELDEPLSIYRDLLPKWKDLGHRAAVAHELECIAYLIRKKDAPLRAVKILGAADSLRRMIESSPTPVELAEYEKEISDLRAKVSGPDFERLWTEGQNLSMDEAIALATREE